MKAMLAAAGLAASLLAFAPAALAQETGITVRSVRVLASDVDALARFYSEAFGMSETRRPVDTPTFKEIVLNTGSTPGLARLATSTPIVIATRATGGPPAGGMAAPRRMRY